jgi:hypothetical protein
MWQRSRLSKNFPKAESIGITGFGKSRILETTSPEHIKLRNHEEQSGPFNIGGRVAHIKAIEHLPTRKVIHRDIVNREIRDSEDKRSNTFRLSKPQIPIRGLIAVRSGPSDHSKIWTVESSKSKFCISTI